MDQAPWIQSRRLRSDDLLARWFSTEPVALAEPLPLSLDRSPAMEQEHAAAPKALAAGASRRP